MTTTLPASLLLFRCPPLAAWMPKRQCETNRGKARAAKRSKKTNTIKAIDAASIAALGLEVCLACPGVEGLVAAGGSEPRPASDLRQIDSTPDPRPQLRRSGRRIGSNIKPSQAEKERRLGPREEENLAKPKSGDCTVGHTSGKNQDGACSECKRIYNRERYYARMGKPVPPKREGNFVRAEVAAASASDATKEGARRVSGPIQKLLGAPVKRSSEETVGGLLAKLRARREALNVELSGVDQAIAAVEHAAEVVLGRPAS